MEITTVDKTASKQYCHCHFCCLIEKKVKQNLQCQQVFQKWMKIRKWCKITQPKIECPFIKYWMIYFGRRTCKLKFWNDATKTILCQVQALYCHCKNPKSNENQSNKTTFFLPLRPSWILGQSSPLHSRRRSPVLATLNFLVFTLPEAEGKHTVPLVVLPARQWVSTKFPNMLLLSLLKVKRH